MTIRGIDQISMPEILEIISTKELQLLSAYKRMQEMQDRIHELEDIVTPTVVEEAKGA